MSSPFEKHEFPAVKSEAAKELAPYLQALLMGQAAILERLDYTPEEGGQPWDKNEILDWLIATVRLKSAPKPGAGGGTVW